MKPYIFGARNGIHILDLSQTVPLFSRALEFISATVQAGGKVLFVGTKRQAQEPIAQKPLALLSALRQPPLAGRHAHQLEDDLAVDQASQDP
jgi:ribosomal protein S2